MKWIKKKAASMASLTLTSVFVIIFCTLVLEFGAWISIRAFGLANSDLNEIYTGARKNTHLKGVGECNTWQDTLQVHPYLAFTHNRCKQLNDINLLGAKLELDNEHLHRIGIFGGSVATEFAGLQPGPFLEEYLNSCFLSGKGKKEFRVLNFADGSWKQPQQVIALLLYGDFIDTAISIEGYNERGAINNHKTDITYVSSNFKRAVENEKSSLLLNIYSDVYFFLRDSWIKDTSFAKLLMLATKNAMSLIDSKYSVSDTSKQIDLLRISKFNIKNTNFTNLKRYTGFLDAFLALAKSKNLDAFVVLQPTPIFKNLSDHEKEVVKDLSYRDVYDQLQFLYAERDRAFDYSRLFQNYNDTIFGDNIHFHKQAETISGHSFADKVLAKRLIADIRDFDPNLIQQKQFCNPVS